MEWMRQLNRAIDYIENNLDGEISYEEAAKIACCSTYYFQRMFSCIIGIPLSEYIRRRRMTKAAFELQDGKAKAMDVGLKYGYDSPTSFHRAFHKIHGVSPTAAREKGTALNAYPRISFSIHVTGGDGMKYRIETKASIRIAGVKVPLRDSVELNFKTVPIFWDETLKSKVFPKICGLSNQQPKGILGVSVYKNPDEIYYFISVATNQPCPVGMEEYIIPAATWVIFECQGNFKESIQSIYKRFFTEWLPFSGYEYAKLPDIEVYPVSDQKQIGGYCEIWLAVTKRKEE